MAIRNTVFHPHLRSMFDEKPSFAAWVNGFLTLEYIQPVVTGRYYHAGYYTTCGARYLSSIALFSDAGEAEEVQSHQLPQAGGCKDTCC